MQDYDNTQFGWQAYEVSLQPCVFIEIDIEKSAFKALFYVRPISMFSHGAYL